MGRPFSGDMPIGFAGIGTGGRSSGGGTAEPPGFLLVADGDGLGLAVGDADSVADGLVDGLGIALGLAEGEGLAAGALTGAEALDGAAVSGAVDVGAAVQADRTAAVAMSTAMRVRGVTR